MVMDKNFGKDLALAIATSEFASKLIELRKDERFNRLTWFDFEGGFRTAFNGLGFESTSKELEVVN